ncbi:hypothetical protein RHGRI_004962 [Rhododendron griersonianum]|uniref:CS domain-containing protein n=1 Tax=Rhododendron griersonianum TaxID=479676 RepID=A0AAV6LD94_9ERIC|nr:hypothetical protein RHGRI_004962 [Rhododendron griersonianum]
MADDFMLDLAELRNIRNIAKRPRVVSLISSEIRKLEKLKGEHGFQLKGHGFFVGLAEEAVNYLTLGSFSWEQDNDKVKIYVSLEGVDQEKMEIVFKPMSVDVKFHDVQGKNYRCAIPKLNKEIVPEKCKVVVKPTRVIITLPKASKGNWLDLHFKEDKLKPKVDKGGDPMAGIMDLMKVKFALFSDETKRTVSERFVDVLSISSAMV